MSDVLTAGVAVWLVAVLSAYVQAVSGFGFSMLGVPLMIPFTGVSTAVVVATTLSFLLTVGSTVAERQAVQRRPVLTLSAGAVAGIPVGLAVLVLLDPRWLTLVIGVLIVAATILLARTTPAQPTPVRLAPSVPTTAAAGILSGAMLSSTSMNGPPVVAVLQAQGIAPRPFRASLQATFVLQDFLAILGFIVVARLDLTTAAIAVAAVPALWLGWWIGDKTFRRIRPAVFRWVVLGMLLASGILAVTQAITQITTSR